MKVTDDEDTESMTVRRSVRVWSNKIKRELVEESLPDEIDGWKIPSDEEVLDDGAVEDQLDESFHGEAIEFLTVILKQSIFSLSIPKHSV